MKRLLSSLFFISSIVLAKNLPATSSSEIESIDDKCRSVRAAFYISDFGTRARVTEVDTCNRKIIAHRNDKFIPLDIKEEMVASRKANEVSQGIIYQIIIDLYTIIKEFELNCRLSNCVAVAIGKISQSSANNITFYDFVKKETGINLKSIPLSEEPKLGFLGILANNYLPKKRENNLIVLDVRDYSFQLTNGIRPEIYSYGINYGPDQFKLDILRKVKGFKNPTTQSLNSLSKKEIFLAIEIARSRLDENRNSFKDIIKYFTKDGEIYAVGEVIESLVPLVVQNDNNYFSRVDVLNAITSLTDLNNKDILAEFPIITSNPEDILVDLIFVYAAMGYFRIEKINILKTFPDIDGLLVDNKYWQ